MRYLIEPKEIKHVKGYGFLSFGKRFGNKYGKKLMNTATKTGIDPAETTSKRVVQKTAEAAGGLIGNKIADKITLAIKQTKILKKFSKMKDKNFPYYQKKHSKL